MIVIKRAILIITGIVLSMFILFSPYFWGKGKVATMNPQKPKDVVTQCVGRFCLDLPDTMVRCRDTYEMNETEFGEEVCSSEDSYEKIWQAHLDYIESLKENRNDPDDDYGEIFEQRTLSPSLKSVLFREKVATKTLGGLLNAGPTALWLEIECSDKYIEKANARVKLYAEAYRLPEPNRSWPIKGQDWFYLRYGAIADTYISSEKAEASFADETNHIDFTVSTRAVDEPDLSILRGIPVILLSRVVGKKISLVRFKWRKLAGLTGEELVAHDEESGEFMFVWGFRGKPDNGNAPEITFTMKCADKNRKEMNALWNKITGSLRLAAQ